MPPFQASFLILNSISMTHLSDAQSAPHSLPTRQPTILYSLLSTRTFNFSPLPLLLPCTRMDVLFLSSCHFLPFFIVNNIGMKKGDAQNGIISFLELHCFCCILRSIQILSFSFLLLFFFLLFLLFFSSSFLHSLLPLFKKGRGRKGREGKRNKNRNKRNKNSNKNRNK